MEIENLKQREVKSLNRFKSVQRSVEILRSFFDKGFTSYEALKAIVKNYYPELDENKLYDLWHIRTFDEELVGVLENVFEKLKAE